MVTVLRKSLIVVKSQVDSVPLLLDPDMFLGSYSAIIWKCSDSNDR